ncbi:hypothetical protein ACIQAS_11010 [Bacillus safensis]|uniref:hypothetical protein n=1 Tax=Bacillus safensis TaxID=561879 RepID=UPI003817716B
MFYFTLVWPDAIFYIEALDTIVLMDEENKAMHVFDTISLQTPDVEEVVKSIVKETTEKVIFSFTPDTTIEGYTRLQRQMTRMRCLFTQRSIGKIMFPITAHC